MEEGKSDNIYLGPKIALRQMLFFGNAYKIISYLISLITL